MKTIQIISLVLTVAACNPNTGQNANPYSGEAADDNTNMTVQIPATGCYSHISSGDTVRLKVETFPNVVTGTLDYGFFEKDKSMGEIEGKLKGDTLLADYTFTSEGIRATRQVIFLIKDSLALEGYGEMEERGGKMIFRNLQKVDFNKGMKLVKVSCVEDIQP